MTVAGHHLGGRRRLLRHRPGPRHPAGPGTRRRPRNLATGIVVFTTLGTVFGLLTVFLLPVRTQLITIVTDLPGTVDDAAAGKGPIGSLVTKLHLQTLVQDHQQELNDFAEKLSSSSFQYVTAVLSGLIAFLTITVLAFLFLSQTETMGKAALNLVPARRREAVRTTTIDAAAAVSGYMTAPLPLSTSKLGSSVAIAGTTAVRRPEYGNHGTVFVYKQIPAAIPNADPTWEFEAQIDAPGFQTDDQFGESVAIDGDSLDRRCAGSKWRNGRCVHLPSPEWPMDPAEPAERDRGQ